MAASTFLGRLYSNGPLLAYASLFLACQLLLQGCQSHLHHSSSHHLGLHRSGPRMDCGNGVSLCGVLVLQSGFGHSHYRHRHPSVHGLWPETGKYGDSKCAKPSASNVPPHHVHSCYQHTDESHTHLLNFQRHEWSKHGSCAGVASSSDYFKQVCTLSAEPLHIMAANRFSGGGLVSMAKALIDAGYPVWKVEPKTGELLLSACAARGQWKLSDTTGFAQACGLGHSAPPIRKSLSGLPAATGSQMCVSGQHGPKCTGDNDCGGVPGCLRCAHSGFCTQVPLSSLRSKSLHK